MKRFIMTIVALVFATAGLQAMQPDHFSWVEAGKMAGMACPEKQEHIEWLKAQNIGLIVTLTEKSLEQQGLLPADGIEFYHIQVPNMGVPHKEQVDQFIERANQVIAQNKAVIVHCQAGIGRTGTFLACWLGKYLNSTSGVETVKELRRRREFSLSTDAQKAFVAQYLAQ
jgi:atypical dual specificity phosphatase